MSKEPRAIFDQHLAPTTPFPLGLEIAKAQGLYLYSRDGKSYLDMIAGVAVSNLGHGHPAIREALHRQVDDHLHLMVYGEYLQSPVNRLVEKLTKMLPKGLDSCYLTNSGAEAVEGALKLAKRATGRTELVAFRGSYHGSTHGALSVSGNETKKRAFRPLLPDVRFLSFGVEEELEKGITERTAAVIIEPIQGDAGVRLPPERYLEALKARCETVGALLIMDEIQTGMGRTGPLYAFEHWAVQPHILCTAKALGGGLPLGAFIASVELMRCFTFQPMLGHITTFGGNPLSCAAAAAALQVWEEEELGKKTEAKGALIESLLQHPRVVEIRRKGLFFALEFSSAQEVQQIVEYCLEHGVVTFWFLSCPESFRIAPPLTIEEAEIREACAVIRDAFDALEEKSRDKEGA